MPEGKPNPQTIASRKYQQKVGLIAKSFKIKRELAEEFADACSKSGVSQAAKISEMMRQFIDEVNKTE